MDKLATTKDFLKRVDYMFPEHIWILGVSGGGDSTFLVWLVEKMLIQGELNSTKIILANIDHGQRAESFLEQIEIKKRWGSVFKIHTYKLKEKKRSEEEMRKYRMLFFESVAKSYKSPSLLFLGHNLTDRIETTFLNILRGSSLEGFLNMREIDPQPSNKKIKAIIRPLLNWSREDIRQYLKEQKINYFNDVTNEDINVSKRNLVRQYVNEFFEKTDFDKKIFYKSFSQIYKDIEKTISHPEVNLIPLSSIWLGGREYKIYKIPINPLGFDLMKLQTLLKEMNIYKDITQQLLKELFVFLIGTRRGTKYFKGRNFIKHGEVLYVVKGDYKFWERKPTSKDMERMYGLPLIAAEGGDMLKEGISVSKWIKKNKIPVFLRNILPIRNTGNEVYILKDYLGNFF